ncbi:sporulation protein Cse60 [Paenibacillus graminis]|uniref:Sporulation protein Cse60 n=2 Tax=Paenibacillus graminis TaxID=189425 RepID=A0A089MAV5_9BACL|nr:sporulation protein Cse60 [Paenibacillus graminis]AIQ70936.1 hypothetical protein PGRAT_27470 [Paenibacillus graminis]MEC0167231.1 sporulation protein Cse60 [Paenibacillus graminis]
MAYYAVETFEAHDITELSDMIDELISAMKQGQLIDIKYQAVPTTVSTNTAHKGPSDTKYTAMVIFTK